MKPLHRVKAVTGGYIVEVNIKKWTLFGIKDKWIPCLTFRGVDDKPFVFKTRRTATERLSAELPITYLWI